MMCIREDLEVNIPVYTLHYTTGDDKQLLSCLDLMMAVDINNVL